MMNTTEAKKSDLPEDLRSADGDVQHLVDDVVSLARSVRETHGQPSQTIITNPSLMILEKTGRARLMSDCVALAIAFVLGGFSAWALNTFVWHETFQELLSIDTLKQMGLFASLGIAGILWLDSKGHYRQRMPYWEMIGNIVTVAFIGFIMGGFVQFAAKTLYSRLWLGFSWSYFAVLVFVGRSMIRRALNKRGEWKIPTLMIGTGPTAEAALIALRRERQMGFDVVSQMSPETFGQFTAPNAWESMMAQDGIGHIFLALEGGELEKHTEAMKGLVRERVPYSIIPPWLGLPSSTLSPHHFMMQDVMMLNNTNQLSLPVPQFLKRSFDIVVASVALVMLSPMFLVLAMLVKRDGGNALFKQTRVGMHGKLFQCFKFRSMKVDAQEALKAYLDKNPEANEEWNKFQKLKDDPRITRLGDFIRRTSIDELPQLLNVIKGDMSLVGPRPIMQGQEVFYEGDFSYYESVRPGITGPWQVSGRNSLTFKQRVELEAWYSRNWSLWLDIVILLKTIPVLLKKDQAF